MLTIVTNPELIQEAEIINYEGSVWIKGVVQVFHRLSAILILGLAAWGLFKVRDKEAHLKKAFYVIFAFISFQYLLGVLTIIGIIGNKTPVVLGVAHQGMALLFLASLLYAFFIIRPSKS